MPNIDKVLGGIGILIFVYLLFNSQQAASVIGQFSSAGGGLIKTLQGR